MADLQLEFDAAASNVDASNPGTALALTRAAGWSVTQFEAPAAELKLGWAGSVDSDGELRADANSYSNRTLTIELLQQSTSAANLQTALDGLRRKLGKLNSDGGTLKVTYASGDTRIYDVQASTHSVAYEPIYGVRHYVRITVTLTAAPFSRGPEVDLGDNVETTLPVLVFTDTGVPGDVPGLGRLVIDNDAASDQWWMTWGIQSRYYSSAAGAALFFQAEVCSTLGGSTTAVGTTGASGAGSNVIKNTALTISEQAVMSTNSSGGSPMNHIGSFRVYARMLVSEFNLGSVYVALEWGEGDFRSATRNSSVLVPNWGGTVWQLVDLGLVTLNKAVVGPQRWEGRIVASSTVTGDDIEIDYLMFVPVDEGSGVASALQRIDTPTAFSARDTFDQTAGALTGKTAVVGGIWAGAGDTDDFTVNATAHTVTRAAVSDTSATTGRFAISGVTAFAAQAVQVDVLNPPGAVNSATGGAMARYSATNRWVGALVTPTSIAAKTANVNLWIYSALGLWARTVTIPFTAGIWYTVTLVIDAAGRVNVWVLPTGTTLTTPLISIDHPELSASGSLATGKPGFVDINTSPTGGTRTYDNFTAWVPPADAAVFANQSIEVRYDGVIREDSAGAIWQPPTSYTGKFLEVPPTGTESRTARVIVKMLRNPPGAGGSDSSIDDLSARLFVAPRYLA